MSRVAVRLNVPSIGASWQRRALVVTVLCAALVAAGRVWLDRVLTTVPPAIAAPHIAGIFFDRTPVTIIFTIAGHALEWPTTADDVRRNLTLWRRLHLAEWNQVPEPLRGQGLDSMLARYRPILMSPTRWDGMTASDWDDVPQPIRTLAYRQMMAYWSGYYDAGSKYGIPPKVVSNMLSAIIRHCLPDHGPAPSDGLHPQSGLAPRLELRLAQGT